MPRPASRHPTHLELEILKVLWGIGPATVRQVREGLAATRPLAYTSVLTMMNIMTRKGYLGRRKATGGYVYRPRVSEHDTARKMLQDLVDRVFDGSTAAVMLNLLETDDLDSNELSRLRKLINRKAKEQTP